MRGVKERGGGGHKEGAEGNPARVAPSSDVLRLSFRRQWSDNIIEMHTLCTRGKPPSLLWMK